MAIILEGRKGINCTLRNGNSVIPAAIARTSCVLIVPCGMETEMEELKTLAADRINCTLRNGNIEEPAKVEALEPVLIVPCGMETNV